MGKFFSITLFFPLIFIMMLLVTLVQYQSQAVTEMSEIMVRDCADAANDAAIQEALRTVNSDIYGKVTLDVEQVWDVYKHTFLSGMNLYSDRNMEIFEGYCPATIIAVNDGYFVRLRTMDYAHESGVPQPTYAFSQKIPYAREVGNEIVADTMNGLYIYSYLQSGGAVMLRGEDIPLESEEGGIHDSSAIALELIQAMDYCIEVSNSENSNTLWDTQRFYIPKELIDTIYYDAVTFEGIAMFNLIQGFDMKGSKPIDYFTMANTQIVEATHYLCFERGGEKYYRPAKSALVSGETFLDTVTTKRMAAINGYSPDPRYYMLN